MCRAPLNLAQLCVMAVAGARDAPREAHPDPHAPTRGAAPTLAVQSVAGCYSVRAAGGKPLDSCSGFWTAPVRLDTVASQHVMAHDSPGVARYAHEDGAGRASSSHPELARAVARAAVP